ncbi:hypothetical protein L596_007608 [Steinernema carpocapsae]|uniref:Peptidase M13 N-terminal domain-containing protein n=1 Tax=Steinernema carpocapsae TaxID=34508 RepID=A0A4U5P9W7_STECR|nr:hypothetical protein L596_007608 [Steinernema carpocapsae]
MLRSLLVLGALLACSGAFAKQKLSTKIRPCESFYDYVCNEDENASEDLFVTQIKQTLYDEILEKFLSLTDTHTDIAVDEFLNASLIETVPLTL